MTIARAKAPTLAWLLTALTCFLVGMAIVESRRQAVALPVWAPADLVETVEGDHLPTEMPEPTATPLLEPGDQLAPPPTLLFEDAPVWLMAGAANVRLARLTVAPGTRLPPEAAAGPTVLLVEAGILSVRVDGAVFAGDGLDPAQIDAALSSGERLVVVTDARYVVRNDGATPAVVLAVTIVPLETREATPVANGGARRSD